MRCSSSRRSRGGANILPGALAEAGPAGHRQGRAGSHQQHASFGQSQGVEIDCQRAPVAADAGSARYHRGQIPPDPHAERLGLERHDRRRADQLGEFFVVNETVVGSIMTGRGQSFRLRRDPSGVQVIEQVDLRKLPPEGNPTPISGRRGDKGGDPSGDTCTTDGIDQIDMMVVYTQDARAGAGGKDAVEADIYLAVELANQSYINSDINQRMRLVHIEEVSYVESGDTILDRDRLKAKADSFVDNVHTLATLCAGAGDRSPKPATGAASPSSWTQSVMPSRIAPSRSWWPSARRSPASTASRTRSAMS